MSTEDRRQQEPGDEALVQAIREGDRNAAFQLARRWRSRLVSLARSILHDDDLAEDSAQLALWRAYCNLDRYDHSRPFEHWLLRIAGNCARDLQLRRMAPRGKAGIHDLPAVCSQEDGLDRLIAKEEFESLRACMDGLSERSRLVVTLFGLGNSVSEIGRAMQLPKNTIQSWLKESLEQLRRCMASKGFSSASLSSPQRHVELSFLDCRDAEPTIQCPGIHALLKAIDHPEEVPREQLEHLATCPYCRRTVALVRRERETLERSWQEEDVARQTEELRSEEPQLEPSVVGTEPLLPLERVYVARWVFVGEDADEFGKWLMEFTKEHSRVRIKGYVLDMAEGNLLGALHLADVPEQIYDDITLLIVERDDETATRAFHQLIRDCNPSTADNILTCVFDRASLVQLASTCEHWGRCPGTIWIPPEIVPPFAAAAATASAAAVLAPSVAATPVAAALAGGGLTARLRHDEQAFLDAMKVISPLLLERIGIERSPERAKSFLHYLQKDDIRERLKRAEHVRDEMGYVLCCFCKEHTLRPDVDPADLLKRPVMDNILWQVAAVLARSGLELAENRAAVTALEKVETELRQEWRAGPFHDIDHITGMALHGVPEETKNLVLAELRDHAEYLQ